MGGRPIPGEILSEAVSAFLLDLDGTLYTEEGAIPGAVAAIEMLRRRGISVRFLTNTTRRSRRQLVERIGSYGVAVDADEVFTAVLAGAAWLRARGTRVVAPFVTREALEDLDDFELRGGTAGRAAGGTPEAVLIGDVGEEWNHTLLNQAFRYVMDGARLVALQRGRYWLGPTGLEVDAGAYVAALEYATQREAVVCGKPNPDFFHGAVASLGGSEAAPPIVMIGDDLWSDIQGAQRAGLMAWLVRTGKYREGAIEATGIRPDRVLGSIADLATSGA